MQLCSQLTIRNMFWLSTKKVVHRPDWYLFTDIFKTQRGCKNFTFTIRCTYLL